GASIGRIGGLRPGSVQRDFPRTAVAMAGVYPIAFCLGAAIAAGSTVPLSLYVGGSWQIGLGFWLVPALLAAALWLPQAREVHGTHRDVYRVRGLLRDPLAWQVTLYLGLQSSLSYIVVGWLPSIRIGRGLTPTPAGLLLSGSITALCHSELVVH
ncbi:cyanate transporter, partial [Pseudomonas syringae]